MVVNEPDLTSSLKLIIGASNEAKVFPVPVGVLINISFFSLTALYDKIW